MEENEIKNEELIELVCRATKLFYEENKMYSKIYEVTLENRLAFYLQTLLSLLSFKKINFLIILLTVIIIRIRQMLKNLKEMESLMKFLKN